jgi:hypothetical protein
MKARRETQLGFYTVLTVPTLLHGSKTWVLAEMKEGHEQ